MDIPATPRTSGLSIDEARVTPDAFDARFSALRPRLLRVSRTLVGEWEAEDVVQETYLRARARLGQLRDPELLEAWLVRIAINEAHSLGRRYARWPAVLADEQPIRDEAATRDASLLELMEQLPIRERMCLVLHYGYGYRLNEVGTMLGVSAINARTILFRARRRLQRKLREADR